MDEELFKTIQQERKFAIWNTTAKAVLIALFFIVVIIIYVNFEFSEFQAFFEQYQNLTVIISFIAVILASITFIPTIPLTLFISVLIGPFPAFIITTLGNTLSALLHYHIGKQIGDVVNFEERRARLPFKLGNLPVNSPIFLLLGRIIPGGPKGLSFICGAYSVPFFLYLWTTFLTNLIGAALVAFGGDEVLKLFR